MRSQGLHLFNAPNNHLKRIPLSERYALNELGCIFIGNNEADKQEHDYKEKKIEDHISDN